jgi:predicted enzyme related to lactoylglutathione lyase
VLDVNNRAKVANCWMQALGYELSREPEQYWTLTDPKGHGVRLVLQSVPEIKTVKNRLHVDLRTEDLEVAARKLESLGASVIDRSPQLIVLSDPEGNEFSLVRE